LNYTRILYPLISNEYRTWCLILQREFEDSISTTFSRSPGLTATACACCLWVKADLNLPLQVPGDGPDEADRPRAVSEDARFRSRGDMGNISRRACGRH